jgi:hypothetical protein
MEQKIRRNRRAAIGMMAVGATIHWSCYKRRPAIEEAQMSAETTNPIPAPGPEKLSAMVVWRLALTQPNQQSLERIRDDPSATLGRAMLWIALSSSIAYTLGALAQLFFIQVLPISSFIEGAEQVINGHLLSGMSTLFILACGLPFTVLASVFGTLIMAGLIHFIADALGGSGSFRQLVYAFAAIAAPFSIVSALLGLIPIVNCLTIPLALYVFVLNVLAIKVVHQLSWGAALGALIILLLLFVLMAVVIGLALWNPLQEFLRSPDFLPSELY